MPEQLAITDSQPLPAGGLAIAKTEPLPESFGDHLASAAKNFWDQVNPVRIAQGLADTATNIGAAATAYGKRNTELFQKAEDAAKRGDYSEAVAHGLHYLLNGIPGVGSTLDEAADQAKSGDIGGSIGKTAGLAAVLIGTPAIKGAAGAVADAAPKAASAISEGVKAGVKAGGADVAMGAGKALTGAVLDTAGVPGHVGSIVGATSGVPQIARGLWKALKEGTSAGKEALNPSAAAPPTGSAGAAALDQPVQPRTPQFEEMGPMPPRQEFTAAAAPDASAALDEIAQKMAGKKFARLDPRSQAAVRKIAEADQAQQAAAAQRTAAAPAPEAAPEAAPPAPQPAASPATPEPVNTSAVETIPFSKPDAPAAAFEGPARTAKARALAHVLDQSGISADDFGNVSTKVLTDPTTQQGALLSQLIKRLNINQTGEISAHSVGETMFELRKLQAAPKVAQ